MLRPTDAEQVTPGGTRRVPRFADYLGLAAVLMLLVALFSLLSDHFLSRLTFTTLANQIPALTVIAVGMTLVLVAAGIDLSVGSVMALGSGVLAVARVNWQLAAARRGCSVPGRRIARGSAQRARHRAVDDSVVHCHAGNAGGRPRRRVSRDRFAVGLRRRRDRTVGTPLPIVGLSPAFLFAVLVVVVRPDSVVEDGSGTLHRRDRHESRGGAAVGDRSPAGHARCIRDLRAAGRTGRSVSSSPISSRPIQTAASGWSSRR